MKRYIMTIMGAFIVIGGCNAATVCQRTTAYVMTLDKNESGKSTSYDSADKVWRVTFTNKTLIGNAACNEISGTYARPTTNLYTTAMDVGTHCWCQIFPVEKYGKTTGLTSYWVYLKNYTSDSGCSSSCAADCANGISSNAAFRSGVYESIW